MMKKICVPAMMSMMAVGMLWAKEPIVTPAGTPLMGELDPYLLKTLYKLDDADAGLAEIVDKAEFRRLIKKHNLKLFGGPMLGSVTGNSARLWVRTIGLADVQVIAAKRKQLDNPVKSAVVRTSAKTDFTAVPHIKGLEAFTDYYYDILVDGKSALRSGPAKFRTFPAKGQEVKFDVGFGGGARYISAKERIWDTVASFQPAAFLFLGDNIYIDLPKSRTKQRVHYYRRQLRPEFRRMAASTAIYAIWDDHDFGANDVSGGTATFKPDWKLPVWRVFKENWNNPYYGGGENQPGCWFDFSIGDVDFFMTDGRYYRSFKDGTMLGKAQKKWLLKQLAASTATFKVIASGTLWTEHADKGGADSWWGVKEEREEIFSLIDRKKIGGVTLISADRHRTDVYRIQRPDGYDLYEFETSKLTNDHTHPTKKQALFSYNKGNFFGMLTFDLTKPDPEAIFRCITADGETVYMLRLKSSQLQKE